MSCKQHVSILFHVSYKVVVVKQWLVHNTMDKKSTETRRKSH